MKRHLAWGLVLVFACGNSKPPQPTAPTDPSARSATTSGSASAGPGASSEPSAPPSGDDVRRGIASLKAGDYNSARTSFEAAIAKNPNQADAHYYLGLMMERTGDKAAAEKDYKRALELSPDLLDAAVNLLAIYVEAKRFDEAVGVAKQALARNPKDAMMHFNYGAALAGKGDQDNARREFDQALKLAPNNAQLYLSYAHQLAEWKKNDIAMTRLKQAEGVAGDDAGVLAAIAMEYKALRAFPECVAILDKAISGKDNAELRVYRGVCKLGQKDLVGATMDFQSAVDKDPSRPEPHYSLGNALADSGKLKDAIAEWEACVKANPTGPLVKPAQTKIGIAKQKLGTK